MGFCDGAPLNLVFDADDTLWDSNIHFLEAFEDFVTAFEAIGLSTHRDRIKAIVRETELELIETLGYGRKPYIAALHQASTKLAAELHREQLRAHVEQIGERLINRTCDLLAGVADTVPLLAKRHTLIMFTKGQRDEQLDKLRRSGLADHFSRVETPHEKDVDAYKRLVTDAGLDRSRTFMIGNSPRSDINPAVRAGLRAAVYIPYPHTWELEHEELDPAEGRIIQLASFPELLGVF